MAKVEPTPSEIAAYIEDMLGELAEVASAHGLRKLATSLLMVAVEAARQSEQARAGEG